MNPQPSTFPRSLPPPSTLPHRGGGTGGPLMPALAIATALQSMPPVEPVLTGPPRSRRILPRREFAFTSSTDRSAGGVVEELSLAFRPDASSRVAAVRTDRPRAVLGTVAMRRTWSGGRPCHGFAAFRNKRLALPGDRWRSPGTTLTRLRIPFGCSASHAYPGLDTGNPSHSLA